MQKIAEEYDERKLEVVYGAGGYKKRTIAFLRAILNSFNIDHGLDGYLNPSSKYKYPEMEELYVA